MDERVQDMLSVLSLNDSILYYYGKLAELEKNNQQNSKEYNDICDLIRFGKQRVRKRLYSYPLNDEYMDKFLDTLGEIEKTDVFYFDYVTYLQNYRHRRLFEHVEELCYFLHTKSKEVELQGELIIDGQVYDLEDGLDELEEGGYDQTQVQSYLDTIRANQVYDKIMDDYELACNQLESNVFMKYLLEAINNETDVKIKNRLIDVKYNVISTISCLEDSFLSDHELKNSIDHYHSKLDYLFNRHRELYPDYLQYHENGITNYQDKLMERNKEKYKNVDEKVFDIIVGLTIKTHLSCIPDQDLRDELVSNNSVVMELTKSNLDKKVLKKSIQLNKEYTINNQFK